MQKFLIGFALFLITFSSCKKEMDHENPVVVWNSPTDGIQINVTDTLHINLHLTDNVGLVKLEVQLVDAQMAPVLPSVVLSLHGTSQDVSFDLPVSGIHIATGSYFLYAGVSDANNLYRAYRNVYITAVPKKLKGFFVATNPSVNATTIYKIDSTWGPAVWSTEMNDFMDMEVSSYWQQVYVNGNTTRTFHATSIDGMTSGFTINGLQTTQPFWGPMSVWESRLWVSYGGDDKIKSLDETGTVKVNANGDLGFYPIHNLQIGNRFFSEQKDVTSSTVKMVAYGISGAPLQETTLGLNVVAMFEKDADNVFVVGNNAGQGHLKIYDVVGNGMWEPLVLPAGTVTAAAQVDTNTLLIAMSSGTIYKFTYAPVGLLVWANGINTSELQYNDVDGNVFSAEGVDVKVYNYNPFSLQRTIVLPDSVKDVALWFNR